MKINKISVLCPSRGRPVEFLRMAESARAKGTGKYEILLYLDRDDPVVSQYVTSDSSDNLITKVTIGLPIGVGKAWNCLAKQAQGELLMMANDDLVFLTPKWDQQIIHELELTAPQNGIFVAHVDDGAPNAEIRCAFPIVSDRWYKALGYFTPECFHFLYHDTWIVDIAKRLDRLIFIPNVLIEHRHFSFKKASYDKTYQRHRIGSVNAERRKQDQKIFRELTDARIRDADRLKALIAEKSGG